MLQDHQTPCSQRRTCRNPASGCNREHYLDLILEGQIEVLRRKNPDAIREVDSPESRGILLAVNARETIPDAGVARHLSVPDLWNDILGLKHQPDALDGRGERLRNGTRDSSEEIGGQICEGQLVLKHAVSTGTVLTTCQIPNGS